MSKKQRLELMWIGKGEKDNPRLEPRILIEDPEKSYGDKNTENILIHGDNLLALKALEQDYAGKVKCIYIDPPYNAKNANPHYEDNVEHSEWLCLIKPRLVILRKLLSDDGSIWISIDDDESHYLKVLCDEIFGRNNFVANVIWEKKYSPQNDAKWLSDSHDHILVYAKNKETWRPNLLPRTEEMDKRYKNPDNDPRGNWKPADFSVKTYNEVCDYEIVLPSGRRVQPPTSRCWVTSKERYLELVADNRIWFGKDGNNIPSLKKFLSEVQQGSVSKTIWFRTEVGDNQDAKKETKAFNSDDVFATPKPERLVERILTLGSNKNDIVLDSFLGSGTTAAVAHKMGRKWIGVELGEHCNTHCVPRLQKVIDGTDQGGISKAVDWKSGGGFRYYTLAPSLLKKDSNDRWVISEEYNAEQLAAAMAKQEGFKYYPDETVYWKQGYSTETDFIYTTTQFLTVDIIDKIHEEMKPEESLLITCKAFQDACVKRHSNITVKKIPHVLLGRCEFGKDDYSLNIINVPVVDFEDEEGEDC
ncbi:site-specific DNA-methyltransferase [Geovibrio thiophilus]|uniref:site-specific DNA-methyltransferase (adenine-specific) n=1 Tax=Geovibrio thiophilus TaxID=139438 RepID=A0A3R5X2A9_9BACT|nr:site-specific DNA-methyltransferase [Geovibrio thiophilus]QAR32750.1 site-specific DNA-methyltransferase [Geovibrio thiophilus]